MGVLDFIRTIPRLLSPADRRLREAAIAAEVWQGEARPLARRPSLSLSVPFGGGVRPPGSPPPIEWWNDQTPPPPTRFSFQPGYSDHTYQQMAAPLGFDGFDLETIRRVVRAHRYGFFWESSLMMFAMMGFAPVLAATYQAIAPIFSLKRHVHGGDRGLSKMIASEVEDALVPRQGLLPSPYFPPSMWGTSMLYKRWMGFVIYQHVDGEEDEDTGIRPRYTRIWEPWAVQYYRSPRKWIAITTEGPIEIKGDGKFTLCADEQEPHLTGAIVALGDEALAGKITQEARNGFLDYFGKPKTWAILPEKISTYGEAGDAFFSMFETMYGPDGRGIYPYGTQLGVLNVPGQGSKAFQDALLDQIIHIYMVLTGSAGTIGSGGPTGAGPYQPQKGGPWNVRHDLIARPVTDIVRAINGGHVLPYVDQNYGDAVARARRSGAWKDVALDIPLPAPDRDERIASEVTRYKALTDQVVAERAAGGVVDQGRVTLLADRFEVRPFTLADKDPKVGEVYDWHVENKLVAPDEVRARLGLPALPDNMGSIGQLAKERAEGGDKTGALAKVDAAKDEGGGGAAAGAADDSGPPAQRNPPTGEPAAPEPMAAALLALDASLGALR